MKFFYDVWPFGLGRLQLTKFNGNTSNMFRTVKTQIKYSSLPLEELETKEMAVSRGSHPIELSFILAILASLLSSPELLCINTIIYSQMKIFLEKNKYYRFNSIIPKRIHQNYASLVNAEINLQILIGSEAYLKYSNRPMDCWSMRNPSDGLTIKEEVIGFSPLFLR